MNLRIKINDEDVTDWEVIYDVTDTSYTKTYKDSNQPEEDDVQTKAPGIAFQGEVQ